MRKWVRRVSCVFLILVVLFFLAGFTYEQIGRSRDSQHRFRVGHPIVLGDRTLNISCAGSGTPAVIFESGGNGYGGYGWRSVQSEVAKFTTACWYDRAGEGWSDPSPIPRSSTTIVNDLHELLQRTPMKGPYVLVGHSIGGEYIRIFTARFPSEVAGLVLVDSTHPDQREPAMMLSPVSRLPIPVRRLLCFALPVAERFGVIRFVMRDSPVDVPPEFRSEETAATQAVRDQRVKGTEAEASQGCAATKNGLIRPDKGSGDPEVDQTAANAGTLGDRPLIVLTAGKYWIPDDPGAAQQIAAFHQIWIHQLQSDLARLSTNGKQIIVPDSGHGIPQEAPAAVVKAVQDVVLQVRQAAN